MQIRGEKKSLVTKRRLYFETLKTELASILLFSAVVFPLLMTIEDGRLLSPIRILLMIYIFGQFREIPRLFRIFGCFENLRVQEKLLGFKFDEEMKKHQIYSTTYADENWFISVHSTSLIVFHRKYIHNVSDVKENKNSNFHGPGTPLPLPCEVTVTTFNNEKKRIVGWGIELLNLKEWSQQ